MQLTIELEADEIATIAYLAKILDIGREDDIVQMGGIYPLPVIMAMNDLLNNFESLLEGIDSPFEIGDDVTIHAATLADRMKKISEGLFEMKRDFEARRDYDKSP